MFIRDISNAFRSDLILEVCVKSCQANLMLCMSMKLGPLGREEHGLVVFENCAEENI
jgi:hypothetical protein